MKSITAAAFGLAFLAVPAFADGHATGDAAAGEKVFKKCKSCHAVVDAAGEAIVKGGKTGPNLYGLFERTAGAQADYSKYGDSLVAAGEGGLTWSEDAFVSYVADPKGFLKETLGDSKAKSKMAFRLKDAEDAANVWAYLVSVGSPE